MRRIVYLATLVVAIVMWGGGARAYGPFVVTDDGSGPLQWTNNTLTWSYDEGPLSSHVGNQDAVQWVTAAMDAWANATLPDPDDPLNSVVQVANVTHVKAGSVGVDLTEANLMDYYELPNVGGLIVFDEDSSIIANWMDPEGVLGLTMPYGYDETGKFITRGIIILNGVMVDQLTEAQFRAALLHEAGHLYNLDHSQVIWDDVPTSENFQLGDPFGFSGNVPTMYPNLVTYLQGTLAYDDEIGVGWVYPSSDFENKYCTITGRIKDRDGNPLQGVYVVAKRAVGEVTKRVDARGMVSGSAYPACTANGTYELRGIRPGKDYHVTYEPLLEGFVEASGFEPFTGGDIDGDGVLTGRELFPPYGFGSGTITKGSDSTVSCDSGGQVIEMDEVQVDVQNPCSAQTEGGGTSGTTEGGAAKGGKCSLSANTTAPALYFALIILLCTIFTVAIAREYMLKKRTCRI